MQNSLIDTFKYGIHLYLTSPLFYIAIIALVIYVRKGKKETVYDSKNEVDSSSVSSVDTIAVTINNKDSVPKKPQSNQKSQRRSRR